LPGSSTIKGRTRSTDRCAPGSSIGGVIQWADEHFPYIDTDAHDAVYRFSLDVPVTEHVLIGDCLNLGGIGSHVIDDLIAQYEEPVEAGLRSLGKHIDRLVKLTPDATIHWIWGNHDNRLQRFARKHPAWRGIIDNPLQLLKGFDFCQNTDKVRIHQMDDPEESFSIGHMAFNHGHYTGKHCACQHVEAYGSSVTFGHSHTQQMFTTVKKGSIPIAGYTIGHMMSKEGRRYLNGRPHRWVTGFAYMEYDRKTGLFTQHLIPIVDGGFFWNGRRYGR